MNVWTVDLAAFFEQEFVSYANFIVIRSNV
jgi:hypothetical protein